MPDGFNGLFVGDFVVMKGLRSPRALVADTCLDMMSSGQEIDWSLVQYVMDLLGERTVSSVDLIEEARRDVYDLEEARILFCDDSSESPSSRASSDKHPESRRSTSRRPAYLDEDEDNSLQALYEESMQSEWYPEWYRDRLAINLQAREKAPKPTRYELDSTGTRLIKVDSKVD